MYRGLICIGLLCSISLSKSCNILSIGAGGSYFPIYMGMLEKYRHQLPQKYDLYAGISIGGSMSGILAFFNHNISEGIEFIKEQLIFDDSLTQHRFMTPKTLYEMLQSGTLYNNDFENIHTNVYNNIKYKSTVPSLIGAVHKTTNDFKIFDMSKYHDNRELQLQLFLATVSIKYLYPHTPLEILGEIDNKYIDGGTIKPFILEEIENHIDCSFYNITLLSVLQMRKSGIFELMGHSTLHHMTNQYLYINYMILLKRGIIAKVEDGCKVGRNNIGIVNFCYMKSRILPSYSSLNFRYSRELYRLGLTESECDKYVYCGIMDADL